MVRDIFPQGLLLRSKSAALLGKNVHTAVGGTQAQEACTVLLQEFVALLYSAVWLLCRLAIRRQTDIDLVVYI